MNLILISCLSSLVFLMIPFHWKCDYLEPYIRNVTLNWYQFWAAPEKEKFIFFKPAQVFSPVKYQKLLHIEHMHLVSKRRKVRFLKTSHK